MTGEEKVRILTSMGYDCLLKKEYPTDLKEEVDLLFGLIQRLFAYIKTAESATHNVQQQVWDLKRSNESSHNDFANWINDVQDGLRCKANKFWR